MSRDVEVLRLMLGRLQSGEFVPGPSLLRDSQQALAAAIAALEVADKAVCVWCGEVVPRWDPEMPEKVFDHMMTCAGNPMRAVEAQVRALTAALEHMQWCRSCAEGSWEQCDDGRTAYRLLHPHKSWCRDSEHEGACISDPSEVDRGE